MNNRVAAKKLCERLAVFSTSLVIFLVFIFYPILRTLYLSFFVVNRQRQPVMFDGLQNYIDMFQSSSFCRP